MVGTGSAQRCAGSGALFQTNLLSLLFSIISVKLYYGLEASPPHLLPILSPFTTSPPPGPQCLQFCLSVCFSEDSNQHTQRRWNLPFTIAYLCLTNFVVLLSKLQQALWDFCLSVKVAYHLYYPLTRPLHFKLWFEETANPKILVTGVIFMG